MALVTDKDRYKICSSCGENQRLINFYKSYGEFDKQDERLRVCKNCLKEKINVDNLENVKKYLRMVDKPFNINLWESALNKPDVVGEYFKLLNSKDYRHMDWSDSIYVKESESEDDEEFSDSEEVYLRELQNLYGHGYPRNEYILFEQKYKLLKSSFQLPTPMHEEYLRDYCINKVKESIAKSAGDFKQAKEWASLAKDSADAGKLKPSQMSSSDLSRGLDGFGQLSRMVEEYQDIMPLLPKFTKRPKDDVDITLWLYVNYIRDLQGMPAAEYEDLYKFYDDRVEDYNKEKLDNELKAGEDNGEL